MSLPLPLACIAIMAIVTTAHACSSAAEGPSSSAQTGTTVSVSAQQPFTRLVSVNTSGFTEPAELVIRDAAALSSAWRTLYDGVPGSPPPAIDFSTKMVVLLALGPRNTGGYTIHFDSITVGGNGGVVHYTVTSPGRNCGTIQMLTSSVDVVSVPRAAGEVRFEKRSVVQEC